VLAWLSLGRIKGTDVKRDSDVCLTCNTHLPAFVCALLLLGLAVHAEAEPFLAAPSLSFDAGAGAFSIAACDLNGDGHLDLVTTNPDARSVSVLLSDGSSSFLPKTDYTTGDGRPLAVCDLNSDGHPDLIAAKADSIVVLLGIGDGTFPSRLSQPAGGSPSGFAVADINHDGHEDVVVSVGGGYVGGVNVLIGKGDGTFDSPRGTPIEAYSRTLAAGDLNGDGELDLVVADETAASLQIMLGKGDGTFATPTLLPIWVLSLSLADLNSDGKLDIIVLNYDNAIHNLALVLLGNGDGTFGPAVAYAAGDDTYGLGSFAIGDLNADGHLDLAIPDFGRGEVAVVPGNGDGSFAPVRRFPIGSLPFSTAIGDFNGDGYPDIASSCSTGGGLGMVAVLLGNGDGTYGVDTRVTTGMDPSAVEVKDFNGDGYPDIASANSGSATVSVVVNDGAGDFGRAHDYSVGPYPLWITSAEMDGTPGLDLVVADFGTDSISILPGLGDGTFGLQTYVPTLANPNFVSVADLDKDGRPDLIAATGNGSYICFAAASPKAPRLVASGPPGISVQLGLGQGMFAARTDIPFGRFPDAITVGDFNGDGNPDLAVADPLAAKVTLLLGAGSGVFGLPTVVLDHIPANVVLARDVDRDGRLDLAVTYKDNCDSKGGVAVLKGNGNGTFASPSDYVTPGGSYGVAIGDLDGDGNYDLATANGTSTVSVLFGASDGTFGSRADFGTVPNPVSVAIGDLDGDGRPDLVVGTYAGNSVSLLFNRGGRPVFRTARAFLPEANRTIPIGAGPAYTCVRLEPLNGDFNASDIARSSVSMLSSGTGSVSRIAGHVLDGAVLTDTDANGVLELPICFARGDLASLFASVHGRRAVTVSIDGGLGAGDRIHSSFVLDVVQTGRNIVRISPNPIAGEGTLSVATSTAGALRVRVFDVNGRLVQTLADLPVAPPGFRGFRLGSLTRAGSQVPSGIYLYRVETADGVATGRFMIMR